MARLQNNFVMALMLMWSILSSATALKYPSVSYKHLRPAHHNISQSYAVYSTQCPTWQQNESACKCGNSVQGLVKCNEYDDTVELLACYCMSQSIFFNNTIIGNCLYTCTWKYWNTLPNETSKLDKQMCRPLKRTGQLCGNCISHYAPSIYSYHIECVECTYYATNWLKYI